MFVCHKCDWKGSKAKCKEKDYSRDKGPLAYAAGRNILCPMCLRKIKEEKQC